MLEKDQLLDELVVANGQEKRDSSTNDDCLWKGPGGLNVESRKKKDYSIYLKAEKRLKPATVGGVISKLEYKELMSKKDKNAPETTITPQQARALLAPYCNEWECQLDVISEDYAAHEELMQAVEMISELMKEMQLVMKKLNLVLTGYFPIPMIRAYFYRCVFQGKLHLMQGVIEDATECFKLMRANRQGYDIQDETISLLRARAICCVVASGDLDGAIIDMKGCCAAIRLKESLSKTNASIACIKYLLEAMATKKIQQGCSRPHYNEQERRDIEKELGLGMYEVSRYKCFECQAERSDTVSLKLCSCCKEKWFCSDKCLKAAWNADHRQSSSEGRGTENVLRIPRDGINIGELKAGGISVHAVMSPSGPTFASVVYDPVKRHYFDSLSDREVVFVSQSRSK